MLRPETSAPSYTKGPRSQVTRTRHRGLEPAQPTLQYPWVPSTLTLSYPVSISAQHTLPLQLGQWTTSQPLTPLCFLLTLLLRLCKLHLGPWCMHAKSLQSCLALWDPMDCSPPVSSAHGIHEARILEWVAMPSSRRSPQLRDRTCISCFVGRFFTAESLGKPLGKEAKYWPYLYVLHALPSSKYGSEFWLDLETGEYTGD